MRQYQIYYSFQNRELVIEEAFNGNLDVECVEALQFALENAAFAYCPDRPLTAVAVTRVVEIPG